MGVSKHILAAAMIMRQLEGDSQDQTAPVIRLRNISMGDARANAKAKRKIRLAKEAADRADLIKMRRKAQNTKHFLNMTPEEQKKFKNKHTGIPY